VLPVTPWVILDCKFRNKILICFCFDKKNVITLLNREYGTWNMARECSSLSPC
jgi:hypothetical protein